MKIITTIASLLILSSANAQNVTTDSTINFLNLIKGDWITTTVDSLYNHNQEIKLILSDKNEFEFLFLTDNKINEKLKGTYIVSNGNLLNLIVDNKSIQKFRVLQVSLSFLKIKNIETMEIFTFERE